MRNKRARQYRRKAIEAGLENGMLKWTEYKVLGPFKKVLKLVDPRTGNPILDHAGEPKTTTILHFTRVNVGIRGLYQKLKHGMEVIERSASSETEVLQKEAA